MAKNIFRIIVVASFLILTRMLLPHAIYAQSGCRPFETVVDIPCTPAMSYRCNMVRSSGQTVSTCCSGSDACQTAKASLAQSATGTKRAIFYPTGKCGEGAIDTALGCIPYTTDAFGPALLGFLAGIVGAIALVIMLFSTIQIMAAGGDAEAVKKGKELFTGAVSGLLFIIFSVTLLKIIAGDIIKLPGF